MKVIIQIPCFNEEETLPLVFARMPRSIPGVTTLEYQIIDDGSTDRTVEVARELGVHHVVSIKGPNRRWLGRAFTRGIQHALDQGADIVVNTDGDNQYPSERIADLVQPILLGAADIVIGDRSPGTIAEFSPLKRFLQRLGSRTVQWASKAEVRDAVSGFRAYSREALLAIHVITNFTYTVDTLMQAHKKGFTVAWLPIAVNQKTRDSRLIRSLGGKVFLSGFTILRMAVVYSPFRTFACLSLVFFAPALFYLGRFLYFFAQGAGSGNVQSLVLSGSLLVIGVLFVAIGIIGDLLSVNRRMVEDVLTRIRRMESDQARQRSATTRLKPIDERPHLRQINE